MRALVVVGMMAATAHAGVRIDQPAGVCSTDAVHEALAALPHVARDATVGLRTELREDRVEAQVTLAGNTRTVTAPTCDELATSVALIIVMTLRDAAPPGDAASAPTIPAIAPVVRPAAATTTATTAASTTTASAPRTEVALLLGGAGDLRGHAALVAGARATRRWWSLGVELQAEPPRRLDLEAGGQITLSRTYVTAAPCAHLRGFGLCGIATAGALRGRGVELQDAEAVTRPILQLGGRVEWSRAVAARLAVRLHVDAVRVLTSARFLVDQMPVWASDSRELRLGAGVVAFFP
jgi:hypothetical protein